MPSFYLGNSTHPTLGDSLPTGNSTTGPNFTLDDLRGLIHDFTAAFLWVVSSACAVIVFALGLAVFGSLIFGIGWGCYRLWLASEEVIKKRKERRKQRISAIYGSTENTSLIKKSPADGVKKGVKQNGGNPVCPV